MIESLRHVQVVGALARLAGNGGWTRILEGQPLEDQADRADVQLLVAAEVLRSRPDGRFEPRDLHPWYDDPEVLASGLVAELRRAVQHSTGERTDGVDPQEIAAMGVASQSVAEILAEDVLPTLPVTYPRLVSGHARILDVGVGTGAIAEALCRHFPGSSAVGLDVSEQALTMAADRLSDSPVRSQVELRRQSVTELSEEEAFDLVWLPQIFVARQDLESGLPRVRRALRPGCWLVMPVAATPAASTDLEQAALEHDALSRGGGPLPVATAEELLLAAGFAETRQVPGVSQVLVMARRSEGHCPAR